MARYFIGIDENGQPYISHASVSAPIEGGPGKKKYLQKIQDFYGRGKSLYLYTQDQVRAFANRGKAKAKFAAQHLSNKIGFGLRRKRDAALAASTNDKSERSRKSARMAADNYQKQYADSLLGKLDYRRAKFKVNGGIKGAAKRAGGRIVDKARDIYGADERERWEQARNNWEKARGTSAEEGYRIQMQNAQNEYAKTAMGRREYRKAKRALRKSIKNSK